MRYGENGKSAKEFLKSKAFIRVLCGGRGAGKTRVLAEDVTRHLWRNAGAKAIIARETEVSQADSSIDTFAALFETLGNAYSPECGLFKSWNNGRTFRLPSRLAIERMEQECASFNESQVANWIAVNADRLCGFIDFRGLPDAEKGKFRGMECSYLALVEADQIVKRQFDLGLACLRWKGVDPATCDERGFIKDRSVVLDTNPPGTKHWIAQMEAEENAKPAAERQMRFWHISTDENAHNLPENYIRDQIMLPYAKNPAMIQRMRYGQYADAFDGSPVFYNYDQTLHVGYDLPWITGAYLVRGWDFGTCNAVVWLMYWEHEQMEYLHALHEQYLEGSDTDRQAGLAIKTTDSEFPFWNNRTICSGLMDYCDPAGNNSNFGVSRNLKGEKIGSCVQILNTHGIRPGTMLWQRGVQIGVTLINRFLAKRDARGQACFKIDAKHCPHLHAAFSGGYRYPQAGEPGFGHDEPLKGEHKGIMDYSHPADAFRYPALNTLKLLKHEYQATKDPLFRQRETVNLNPERAM